MSAYVASNLFDEPSLRERSRVTRSIVAVVQNGALLPNVGSPNKLPSLPLRPAGCLRQAISLRSVRRYVEDSSAATP